jgi:hypothetical protein
MLGTSRRRRKEARVTVIVKSTELSSPVGAITIRYEADRDLPDAQWKAMCASAASSTCPSCEHHPRKAVGYGRMIVFEICHEPLRILVDRAFGIEAAGPSAAPN